MKTISLGLSLLTIIIAALPNSTLCPANFGLCLGSPCSHRLLYLIFHANGLHLAINLYAFLTLSFLCHTTSWHLSAGILIAGSLPSAVLGETPIVGLSTLIYAMAGMVVMGDTKWKPLVVINLLLILVQALLVGIAWQAHLYCFSAGLLVGFLFTPRIDK